MPHIEHLCNNKATVVTIGDNEYFFSYTTLVAFRGYVPAQVGLNVQGERAYVRVRRNNNFSKTTGRHINEMGVREFAIVNDEEFASLVDSVA